MRMTKTIMLLAVLLPVLSAWAGDLTTDNLTVTKDATIMGNMYFSSTVGGTNGGGTATGGTITTNGNYLIHTFTNVGTANFVVSGGSLVCDVLVVAGGGGGDSGQAGGGGVYWGSGGGGGTVEYQTNYSASGSITVTVGGGGSGSTGSGVPGGNGTNSVFGTITAICGYGAPNTGELGGSNAYYRGGMATSTYGGGGAGGGENGFDGVGGIPGHGLTNSITGSPVGYAGGGGGSPRDGGNHGVGLDGGGNATINDGGNGSNGKINTGGGGGGAGGAGNGIGGSGGPGIVIVRYPMTSSSNVTTLSISSNGISQTSSSGANVLMSKVGIGTNNPAEQLHVVGNARVDGTNIVSAITLGGETRTTWPTGNLSASNNLSDITNKAAARANLGLGSAATNEAGAFLSPNGDGSQITGITAAQVGALSTNAGALIAANNLSDVANAGTARSNLGLGTAATNEASAFLSTAGGVVNGDISLVSPAGDIPMGVYTNQ